MRAIIKDEIARSSRLRELAAIDSRLGFHSEAEGYKYFPALLDWRIEQLESLLDAPAPAPTPSEPKGPSVHCAKQPIDAAELLPLTDIDATWRIARDDQRLYVHVRCPLDPVDEPPLLVGAGEHLVVAIEPRRLWPTHRFIVDPFGRTHHDNKSVVPDPRWSADVVVDGDRWEATFSIPFVCVKREGFDGRPMRINVDRIIPDGSDAVAHSWIERHPLRGRLRFAADNPRDYGQLLFV